MYLQTPRLQYNLQGVGVFQKAHSDKNIRFFCKWSNMWSDRRFNDFSTFGRAEKSQCFQGFSALLEKSTPSAVIESRTKHSTKLSHTPKFYYYAALSKQRKYYTTNIRICQ